MLNLYYSTKSGFRLISVAPGVFLGEKKNVFYERLSR